MKREDQQLEHKESWRDEWLETIAAFANTDGGLLRIGIRDNGTVKGVEKAARLLEDIPSKVLEVLQLKVDVWVSTVDGLEVVDVAVPACPYAVAYRGRYFQRSGSTTREIKGSQLANFLVLRSGNTFDNLPQSGVVPAQLSEAAFKHFTNRASRTADAGVFRNYDLPRHDLLQKLELLTHDNELTKAAILAFHEKPSQFMKGAYIQIAFFGKNPRPLFENEIMGSALEQVEQTLDLLDTKYLISRMTWSGVQRIDRKPVPHEALREGIVNAIIHRDYADPSPIQIKVGDDYVRIFNPGGLPDKLRIEQLEVEHPSLRRNPLLANVFKRAGYVEAWGTGFATIRGACARHEVDVTYGEAHSGFAIEFRFSRVEEDLPVRQRASPLYEIKRPAVSKTDVAEALEPFQSSDEPKSGSRRRSIPKKLRAIPEEYAAIIKQFDAADEKTFAEGIALADIPTPSKMLLVLKRFPGISMGEVAVMLDLSPDTIRYHVKMLKAAGIIMREGTKKQPQWRVTEV